MSDFGTDKDQRCEYNVLSEGQKIQFYPSLCLSQKMNYRWMKENERVRGLAQLGVCY